MLILNTSALQMQMDRKIKLEPLLRTTYNFLAINMVL